MTTSTKTKIKLGIAAVLSLASLDPLFGAFSAETSNELASKSGAFIFYLIIIVPLLVSVYRASHKVTDSRGSE